MGARRILKLTNQGDLRFYEDIANGVNKITMKAPATLASDYTITLPTGAGASGEVIASDGAGGLSFVAASSVGGKPLEYFRHVGATNETWYGVGDTIRNTLRSGDLILTDDLMYAEPFASLRGGTIDRIRYNVAVAGDAASKIRVGVYSATSDTNLYPSARVADFGELAGNTTGYRDTTISQVLTAGTLYWFVMLVDVGSGTVPQAWANVLTNMVFGHDVAAAAGSAARNWISVVQAYGSLPATFPAGGTLELGSVVAPRMLIRYSA